MVRLSELEHLLERSVRPNRLRDTRWLERFLGSKSGFDYPIMLGLGESWLDTPPALIEALGAAPPSAHGYQLSMYGLPRLRQVLKRFVTESQGLDAFAGSFEVAVSWSGTRDAMSDFGCLVRSGRGGPLVATAVAPSWDYAGVLEPLGYSMQYLGVSVPGWLPDQEAIRRFAGAAAATDLLIINAQHNPTGHSWRPETVESLLDIARAHNSAVLIDDAYFGFAQVDLSRTSAVRQLLADPQLREGQWLAVRSLGKQFHCNGWGLGAVLASPALLDDFVNDFRARRAFNIAALAQHAMADWLEDAGGVSTYLARQRAEYDDRRRVLRETLSGAGFPLDQAVFGESAPYALLPVPPRFAGRSRDYLEACAVRAGVFMSEVWPADRDTGVHADEYAGHVRTYIGPPPSELAEAVSRLHETGLGYSEEWP